MASCRYSGVDRRVLRRGMALLRLAAGKGKRPPSPRVTPVQPEDDRPRRVGIVSRIPAAFRDTLEAAGFEWMWAAKVYFHPASRGMISYEELTSGAYDLARLRERILEVTSGHPRGPS